MLISSALDALTTAGVVALPVDAHHLELRYEGWTARVFVQETSRVLRPSDVTAILGRHRERGLLVMRVATTAVRQALEQAGWSWLVAGPDGFHGTLRLGTRTVAIGESRPGQTSAVRPGPVPWGWITVVRALLSRPAVTQNALAVRAGVSQPRVSQILGELAGQGLVERGRGGWLPRDFDSLLQLWLDSYPGPGGITTHWYGLEPARRQAAAAVALLIRAELAPVVSGDLAADLIAPWRTPTRAVLYARAGADLTSVGLTPTNADAATLELVVPEDGGVWPEPPEGPAVADPVLPIADPVQVLWDVRRTGGADAGEAVERLRDALRRRGRTDPAASGAP